MNWALAVVGLLFGLVLPPLLVWLVFAYPYSTISLRWLWIPFVAGFVVSVIGLVVFLVWVSKEVVP